MLQLYLIINNMEQKKSHTNHEKSNDTSLKRNFSPDSLPKDILEIYGRDDTKTDHTNQLNAENKARTEYAKSKGQDLNIFGSEYFYNYELSWLKFNWRVLAEAQDDRNPVMERVKFIGIVCSNLDEFFQKRVGGLKRQIQAGVHKLSIDGKTPVEQLKNIRQEVKKMLTQYRECFFKDLIPELKKNHIHFLKYNELNAAQKSKIDHYFEKQLYPILTPLAVDQSHPFPQISNKSRSFAVELRDPVTGEELFARIKIPSNRPRWLTAEQTEKSVTLVEIDDVIRHNIERLFPGAELISAHVFRVTRSADLERNEEEADDLLELIEDELRERRFAEVVRLEIADNTPVHIKKFLQERMKINESDVFQMQGPIGLADCMQLYKFANSSNQTYPKWTPSLHPVFHHEIDEDAPSIFDIIKNGDFIVQHPYHSFATSVQRFVEEAVNDPKVLAIKQTLYRTSKDSPLMHSLMRAADDGKQVAVLVELKARFDEERNIEWAQRLEKAGVHVAYGLPGLKIHSKLTTVIREENNALKRYIHIGTGNYHPDTAQLYEDLGLFTCDDDIAHDVSEIFNLLTGFAPKQEHKKLLVAPFFMRKKMEEFIQFETDQAKLGKTGRIIAKMNSLEDPHIIQKLYEASKAGVKIDLIIRGVCRLKPQIKGLSENIRVHSIIGRFLEHSRIFYFTHGGDDLYYFGSADWMHRNLDARVEAITPIENPNLKQYLQFLLNLYLRDNRQRWTLEADGTYRRVKKLRDEPQIASHTVLMNHTISNRDPIPGL